MPPVKGRWRVAGPNKRSSHRRDLTYGATVFGVDAVEIGRCQVLDISETGVRIAIAHQMAVPDEFLLALTAARTVQRACRVVWRNENEIGAAFQTVEDDAAHARDPLWRRSLRAVRID